MLLLVRRIRGFYFQIVGAHMRFFLLHRPAQDCLDNLKGHFHRFALVRESNVGH